MDKFDTAPYSFRLNLTRDEELEIHRFLNSDIVKIHYGDKSKFIKKALLMTIAEIKENDIIEILLRETNTLNSTIQETIKEETEKIVNDIRNVIGSEVEKCVKQALTQEISEVKTKDNNQPIVSCNNISNQCFGTVPDTTDEDVSEDVWAFLEDL